MIFSKKYNINNNNNKNREREYREIDYLFRFI